ncbi:MAG: C40 family peptidase [Cytophagaceae bacterium]|nr:C40 family peptidase [Cytophagaceae bacterium]
MRKTRIVWPDALLKTLVVLGFIVNVSSCAMFSKPSKPANVNSARRSASERTAPTVARPRDHSIPPGSPVSNLIATARSYIETPYSTGGNTSVGLDCSGFVCVCFRQVGVSLPRVARQQAESGSPVALDELQPGDIVFFNINKNPVINHTGIVTEIRGPEEVWFIHSSSSRGVREANLFTPYWRNSFARARRVSELKVEK